MFKILWLKYSGNVFFTSNFFIILRWIPLWVMSVLSNSVMSAIRKINGTKDGNKEVGYWAGDKSGCI